MANAAWIPVLFVALIVLVTIGMGVWAARISHTASDFFVARKNQDVRFRRAERRGQKHLPRVRRIVCDQQQRAAGEQRTKFAPVEYRDVDGDLPANTGEPRRFKQDRRLSDAGLAPERGNLRPRVGRRK